MADETITPDSPVCDLWPEPAAGETETRAESRLRARARTSLFRLGVMTVGELTAMSAADVRDARGAGNATVGEIRRVLKPHRLSLKGDEEAVRTDARVLALIRAGLSRKAALRFALEAWPAGEIAPGITLTVTEGGS